MSIIEDIVKAENTKNYNKIFRSFIKSNKKVIKEAQNNIHLINCIEFEKELSKYVNENDISNLTMFMQLKSQNETSNSKIDILLDNSDTDELKKHEAAIYKMLSKLEAIDELFIINEYYQDATKVIQIDLSKTFEVYEFLLPQKVFMDYHVSKIKEEMNESITPSKSNKI